jgi:MFS family permease
MLAVNSNVSTRALVALILSSALVTLDGTAVTVALPAIGRDLGASFAQLQWVTDTSLLMLALLLLPAGIVGDRVGRRRVTRLGVAAFAAASIACGVAPAVEWLIAARLAQGAAAAFVVPGAIAILRATYADENERARVFGMWAGWSGLASAAGPLLGGALVDLISWRAVLFASAACALPTLMLLKSVPESCDQRRRSIRETLSAVMRTPNCLAGNVATFALYFGLFGISFLLAIYTQDVLGYSATWAAVSLLPVSLMMLALSERFGPLATRYGPRRLVAMGTLIASGGILWLATGPDQLEFWTRIVAGTTVFGMGLAVAVAPMTHAAVSSVSHDCAGAASAINNAIVRAAGFLAIAILGSLASAGTEKGGISPEHFRQALATCAGVVMAIGIVATQMIRDTERGGLAKAA